MVAMTTAVTEQQLFTVVVLQYAAILILSQTLICGCNRSTRAKDDVSTWLEKRDSLSGQRSSSLVQNMTVERGERAVFKCKVENLGARTVSWRRHGDGHPLTIGHFLFAADTRMSVDINQRTNDWSLIIQDVRLQDEGIYQCHLTVKDRQEFTNDIRLIVRTVQIKGTAYVDVGSAISLICTANRKPNVPWRGLHWLQNGRRLDTNISEGITVVERNLDNGLVSSELTMKAATASMAGDYVCKASEEDNASVFVYVLDDFLMKRRAINKGISAERITGNDDATSSANINRRTRCSPLHLINAAAAAAAMTVALALVNCRLLSAAAAATAAAAAAAAATTSLMTL